MSAASTPYGDQGRPQCTSPPRNSKAIPWVCASTNPRISCMLLTPEIGLPETLVVTSGKAVQPLRMCSRSRLGVPVMVALEAPSVR